jgi:RNA polymerase sigma factor (sigma-70 family)
VLRAERPGADDEGMDLLDDPLAGDVYEDVLWRVAGEQVRPLLTELTEREREILDARGAGDSLRTIGRRLGVSQERVRTVEGRALAKLRVAAG